MPLTQKNSLLKVMTSFPDDTLLLHKFTGVDRLGELFEFRLELLSENPKVDITKLLGASVTVSATEVGGEKQRYFNGIATSATRLGHIDGVTSFAVTLRPEAWLLTRRATSRIFTEMSDQDIIQEVLRKGGVSNFRFAATSQKTKAREYVVQYRETDFNFVSRIMEEAGYYYYFEHADKKHTMVLANNAGGHDKCPAVAFFPPREAGLHVEAHLSDWAISHQMEPPSYALADHYFEQSSAPLNAAWRTKGEGEIFDFPGGHHANLDHYAQFRGEAMSAQTKLFRGSGRSLQLHTGGLFKLTNDPYKSANEYLIVGSRYELAQSYLEGEDETTQLYSLSAIDSKTTFRSPRRTPKPYISGPQTAVVVGENKGDECWTDKYGRVRVKFFWQRDDANSCWIRVSQAWAGSGWGSIHIPRVGQEVIVEFLEGDPDRPIITGRVYNTENMPPYALPANATQSGIKSRTFEGGKTTFNELRFEDKKDKESIYFQAERDFERVVKNNDSLKVGFDTKKDGDQTIEIYNNRKVTIEKGDDKLELKSGDQSVKIAGDQSIQVSGDQSTKVSGDQSTKVSGKCTIVADKEIVLKVGASQIVIKPNEIKLSSATVAVQANAEVKVNGTMIKTAASAILQLQGSLVKIN